MCGLVGIFAYKSGAPAVKCDELFRIRDHMVKRGPDGAGFWISENLRVGLGHRRLAIIDLSTEGDQPLGTSDGRFQIVFNGEIYNHSELRIELEKKGVKFRSSSDTEVLLQMFIHYGSKMCKRLRGMYALAIWDNQNQSLFLARDPFGIKPLYIVDDGNTIRFASQVKALLAGGEVQKDKDPQGKYDYLIWGHVTEPNTYFSKISAVTPGTWIYINLDKSVQQEQFDSVEELLAGHTKPSHNYHSLRDALLDTVSKHLVSDVPVGLFLSAGIDSTTLAGLATECGSSLQTVTLGFEEYRGTNQDEVPKAEAIAKYYGTEHHTVWIDRKEFDEISDQFFEAMDQPTIDGLNTWLVSRAAHKIGLKVALSGLGGDEFFGGYPSFDQLPKMLSFGRRFKNVRGFGRLVRQISSPVFNWLGSPKMASLLEYGTNWNGVYMLRRAMRMPWEIKEQLSRYEKEKSLPMLNNATAMVSFLETTRYMRNQLLRDSDWASMAHSIELRVPLVDIELTRFIAYKRNEGQIFTKIDLANTAKPSLPKEIINRPKSGFEVPIKKWLLEKNAEFKKIESQERGLREWQKFISKTYDKAVL